MDFTLTVPAAKLTRVRNGMLALYPIPETMPLPTGQEFGWPATWAQDWPLRRLTGSSTSSPTGCTKKPPRGIGGSFWRLPSRRRTGVSLRDGAMRWLRRLLYGLPITPHATYERAMLPYELQVSALKQQNLPGQPCPWLDTETQLCRNYDQRRESAGCWKSGGRSAGASGTDWAGDHYDGQQDCRGASATTAAEKGYRSVEAERDALAATMQRMRDLLMSKPALQINQPKA